MVIVGFKGHAHGFYRLDLLMQFVTDEPKSPVLTIP